MLVRQSPLRVRRPRSPHPRLPAKIDQGGDLLRQGLRAGGCPCTGTASRQRALEPPELLLTTHGNLPSVTATENADALLGHGLLVARLKPHRST
jgi:hypothetical protein